MHCRTRLAGWGSFIALFIVLGAGLVPLHAFADGDSPYYGGVDLYEEFGKRIKAAQQVQALTDSVFGDQVSLYNGATAFSATDVSIPGNNALPVALSRRYAVQDHRQEPADGDGLHGFGDWDLDVPYIDGTFTSYNGWKLDATAGPSTNRCSDNKDFPYTFEPMYTGGSGEVPVDAVWNGNQLHIPGEGDQELLANTAEKSVAHASAGTYMWVTSGHWKLSCIGSVTGLPGEGFVAISPSGTSYTFDYAIERQTSAYAWRFNSKTKPQVVPRERIFLLATHVVDRFGNSVDYHYDGAGHLVQISSSDGRSITLAWSGDTISSVTGALGTWTYGYVTATWTNQFGTVVNWTSLSTVTRPDGSQWHYAIDAGAPRTNKEAWPNGEPINSTAPHCQTAALPNSGAFTYEVTSPSDATATFDFTYMRHYRSMVPLGCALDSDPDHNYPLNATNFFGSMYLAKG